MPLPDLRLDHASLQVPRLDTAMAMLQRLGLTATPTPGDEARHARLYLDRAYLEVSVPTGRPVSGPRILLFMHGARDVFGQLPALKARGIEVEQAGPYQGADGVWDDVVLKAPAVGIPAPVLVSRRSPPELAADWPPAAKTTHPSGARTLQAVLLVTHQTDEAVRFYEQLGGRPDEEQDLPAFGARRRRVHFPGGRFDLFKPAQQGKVAAWLAQRGPGVLGVSFGVASLDPVLQRLVAEQLEVHAADGVIFTDAAFGPDALFGFEPLP